MVDCHASVSLLDSIVSNRRTQIALGLNRNPYAIFGYDQIDALVPARFRCFNFITPLSKNFRQETLEWDGLEDSPIRGTQAIDATLEILEDTLIYQRTFIRLTFSL